ncbi:MAG: PilZ domain-containing protein [Treponema sp.]|nr:PilZ domain-containing protein [Treponema sp.]
MNSIIPILIILIITLVIIRLIILFSDKIRFISKGLDSRFKMKEILLLWKLAKTSGLEDPASLFLSVHALNRSIAYVISTTRANHTEHTKETQEFLSRLYEYRTKVELDPKLRKGLKSSKGIAVGQKIRVVVKGHGIFSSTVLNNGRHLIIILPLKDGLITIPALDWIHKTITVYLWRSNDASYVFDAFVIESGVFNGKVVLYLQHTDDLLRAQKRKSVRCQCKIPAQMFLVKSETTDLTAPEHGEGLRCIIEDISEGGAFVHIGGKGKKGMQIKLQFTINESLVVMHGFVKSVEFDMENNQSRLHFECTDIEPRMKNAILSYVYNVLPQDEKEMVEAINLAEQDEIEAEKIIPLKGHNDFINLEKMTESDIIYGETKPLTESPWEENSENYYVMEDNNENK